MNVLLNEMGRIEHPGIIFPEQQLKQKDICLSKLQRVQKGRVSTKSLAKDYRITTRTVRKRLAEKGISYFVVNQSKGYRIYWDERKARQILDSYFEPVFFDDMPEGFVSSKEASSILGISPSKLHLLAISEKVESKRIKLQTNKKMTIQRIYRKESLYGLWG